MLWLRLLKTGLLFSLLFSMFACSDSDNAPPAAGPPAPNNAVKMTASNANDIQVSSLDIANSIIESVALATAQGSCVDAGGVDFVTVHSGTITLTNCQITVEDMATEVSGKINISHSAANGSQSLTLSGNLNISMDTTTYVISDIAASVKLTPSASGVSTESSVSLKVVGPDGSFEIQTTKPIVLSVQNGVVQVSGELTVIGKENSKVRFNFDGTGTEIDENGDGIFEKL